MISLYAFLDETGDPRKDDRIFMCGYAGWDETLTALSKKWGAELETSRVKSIHSTELLSQCGAFFGWDSDEAGSLTERCIDAVRTTVPIGLAVGFDAKHYRSLTVGQQNEIGRPLLICVSRAIDVGVGVVTEMRARGDRIAGINLAFDDSGRDEVEILRTWVQLKKARPQLREYVASVGFADDRRSYPLQAADLLANLTNRYWQPDLLKKPQSSDRRERHLRRLLTPDPAFQFEYRVSFVTADEMNEAVRLHQRLY